MTFGLFATWKFGPGTPAYYEGATRDAIGVWTNTHLCNTVWAAMDEHSPCEGSEFDALSAHERGERSIRCTQQARECGDNPVEYDKAERLLAEAIRLVPDEPVFRANYVGFCTQVAAHCASDGEYDKAIRYLQCVLIYTPNDPEMWLDLGTAYANQNMALEALQAWSECLRSIKRAKAVERECTQAIAANVMIIARALDPQLSVKKEQKSLRTVIAQLIAALKTSGS